MIKKLPVYEPVLGSVSKENVIKCLDTNWISSRGEFIEKFEDAFSKKVGSKYALTVSNGTVALHLALLALDIGPGDEVIVPTFTYIASVNVIKYVGATPVFVDSLADTWQVSPEDINSKITNKTKAIIVVHLYGHPSDTHTIVDIANKNNLKVIEDCAEAFGSYIFNEHVGNKGHISTYSFFGNKTITTGEGGMVTTNDPILCQKIKKLKGQGLADTREYWHDIVGYNYRMTNICAAIGLGQLELADEFLRRKREIATQVKNEIQNLPLEMLWEKNGMINSFWMITIATKDPKDRNPLRTFLKEKGIETRPSFYPAHTMPMYLDKNSEQFPIASSLSLKGINLPSSPALTGDDVEYLTNNIKDYFKYD